MSLSTESTKDTVIGYLGMVSAIRTKDVGARAGFIVQYTIHCEQIAQFSQLAYNLLCKHRAEAKVLLEEFFYSCYQVIN